MEQQIIVQELFTHIFSEKIISYHQLTGGDINQVFEITTAKNQFVVKLNKAELYPNMFEKEARGLTLIKKSKSLTTPAVIEFGQYDDTQYLILEKINTGKSNAKTWENFGQKLAHLHQTTHEFFGLDESNFIGSLVQNNAPQKTWEEFLITQRLQPMLEMAVNQGDINYVEGKKVEAVYSKINELLPHEKPSLVHGDLWSGNILVDANTAPVLIDPAVSYGHREMDIAMMHLFGGFPKELFESYNENFPLEKGWEKRIAFNQLYPLLVHVNLFGRSYWSKIEEIVLPFYK